MIMEDKKIIDNLKSEMHNIPFGNTAFQIKAFIMNEPTPERQYRTALLQVDSKIKALELCKFRRARVEIDINELKEKWETATKWDKQRIELDLEEKSLILDSETKLINDAVYELAVYKQILDTIPKFTREEFENAELGYWTERLTHDARLEIMAGARVEKGTLATLEKINLKPSIKVSPFTKQPELTFEPINQILTEEKIGEK
jgi:hypothetical protein